MADADEPILRVENLSKRFAVRRDLVAVDDVSFELRAHQTIGIVGESGSGKSTVAKCLVRLHEPDGGAIAFRSTDVLAARGPDLAGVRRSMQLIYQDPYSSLNPLMSVAQAVSEPATVHGLVSGREASKAYVAEILGMVGLPEAIAGRRPRQLSGGQRQRVAIARAMAAQPEVLIADEPISALDVSIQAQILAVFGKLRAEQGVALILIAHQLNVVAHIADIVMVMYLGRIVEAGPVADVLLRPRHPYTRALLSVLPDATRDQPGRRLTGEPPDPTRIPAGCRFHPRCPRLAALPPGDGRAELCRATPVPVLPALPPAGDPATLVACHLADLDESALLEPGQPSVLGAE
jgi:oligopeptide/dipeptide ABC transporter ATP-binding protein